MKKQSLNYILKGTRNAINDAVNKYYADCYLDDKDINRLGLWQLKIEAYLLNQKDGELNE